MRKNVLFIGVFICLCSLMPAALWHVSLDKSSLPDVKEVDKLFNPFIYSQIKKQLPRFLRDNHSGIHSTYMYTATHSQILCVPRGQVGFLCALQNMINRL